MFANTTENWIDAEKICQGSHPLSHLVAIETKDEEEFIIKYRNYNSGQLKGMYRDFHLLTDLVLFGDFILLKCPNF